MRRIIAIIPGTTGHICIRDGNAILLSEYAYHTEETLSRSSPAQSGHE